jgi:hypothetical protein
MPCEDQTPVDRIECVGVFGICIDQTAELNTRSILEVYIQVIIIYIYMYIYM